MKLLYHKCDCGTIILLELLKEVRYFMTSAEKMNMVLNLEAPKKRSDIPVAPHIVTWAGTVSGLTQAEIISDGKKWLHALDKVFQVIGKPDTIIQAVPNIAYQDPRFHGSFQNSKKSPLTCLRVYQYLFAKIP